MGQMEAWAKHLTLAELTEQGGKLVCWLDEKDFVKSCCIVSELMDRLEAKDEKEMSDPLGYP